MSAIYLTNRGQSALFCTHFCSRFFFVCLLVARQKNSVQIGSRKLFFFRCCVCYGKKKLPAKGVRARFDYNKRRPPDDWFQWTETGIIESKNKTLRTEDKKKWFSTEKPLLSLAVEPRQRVHTHSSGLLRRYIITTIKGKTVRWRKKNSPTCRDENKAASKREERSRLLCQGFSLWTRAAQWLFLFYFLAYNRGPLHAFMRIHYLATTKT